jgi:histone chaperone ASF1
MSSPVHVSRVQVLDNPAPFTAPIRFEITFDSFAEQLKEELEWKVIYVGSAQDEQCDQVLDSVLVGPVKKGRSRFVLEVDAPNGNLIPNNELLEVTVILLTCSYKGNEFVRIGYYVNNELQAGVDPEARIEVKDITRNILLDTPVVTRYDIAWDDSSDADALKSFMQQNSKLGEELEEDDVEMDEVEEEEEEEEEEEDVQEDQARALDEEDVEEEEEEEEEDEASEIDLEEDEDDVEEAEAEAEQ